MIGLATGHKVYNYGTRLQAYAMQNIMESRHLDCEILHFNKNNGINFKNSLTALLKYDFPISSSLYNTYTRKKNVEQYLKGCNSPVPHGDLRKHIEKRFAAFDNFNKNELRIRELSCNFYELTQQTKTYSAVFCGSDQAWLPQNVKNQFYTLTFCDPLTKRISYAPSFGIDNIPSDMVETYKSFLTDMDYISVREARGKEIVEALTGRNAQIVLDPTLLLDVQFWNDKIMNTKEMVSGSYIFCYFLGKNPMHRQAVTKLKKRTGLKVVNISHMKIFVPTDSEMSDVELYDVSPFEFLKLIKNAQYVCTDSFHCTAFALQFHTDFSVFLRHAVIDENSTNSRINSMLGSFNVNNRIVYGIDDITSSNIDFQAVDEKLQQAREQSNAYLDEVLLGLR